MALETFRYAKMWCGKFFISSYGEIVRHVMFTHFMSLVISTPPENNRKPVGFFVFRGYRKKLVMT